MAPSTSNPDESAAAQLDAFIRAHPKLVALTGAGISTGSGIPTYRDRHGNWQRSDPIQHQDFVQQHGSRQRYWLRSFAGWPFVRDAEPTIAHRQLARLEAAGHLDLLVTQNVDRLHQKAGSKHVVDLHGRLDQVICLECGKLHDREIIQQELSYLSKVIDSEGHIAPDGDADVEARHMDDVIPPRCCACDGILKPNVVFFGGNVPREQVERVYNAIDAADGLLIVGTSLQVFSGFRFCRFAANSGTPMASINPGISRGDELIQLKLQQEADDLLGSLPIQDRAQHVIK